MSALNRRKKSAKAAETKHTVFRFLFAAMAVAVIVMLGKAAYTLTYNIFDEQAMEAEPGTDVSVTIPEGATAKEIATILQENGLISNVTIFLGQERFSSYHGELKGGSYILNTSQTPTEMMEILAGVNTEGQPSQTKEEAEGTSDAESSETESAESEAEPAAESTESASEETGEEG